VHRVTSLKRRAHARSSATRLRIVDSRLSAAVAELLGGAGWIVSVMYPTLEVELADTAAELEPA